MDATGMREFAGRNADRVLATRVEDHVLWCGSGKGSVVFRRHEDGSYTPSIPHLLRRSLAITYQGG